MSVLAIQPNRVFEGCRRIVRKWSEVYPFELEVYSIAYRRYRSYSMNFQIQAKYVRREIQRICNSFLPMKKNPLQSNIIGCYFYLKKRVAELYHRVLGNGRFTEITVATFGRENQNQNVVNVLRDVFPVFSTCP